jgi:hypothetical protein
MGTRRRAQIRFLVDHLRWCLDQPLVYGDPQRFASIGRSLGRLLTVFDAYVEEMRSPAGPLMTLADPGLLPFSHEAQQVKELLQQYDAVAVRLHHLALVLNGALNLFCAGENRLVDRDLSLDGQKPHDWPVLLALKPCIAASLVEGETCLATVDELLQTDPLGGGTNPGD